MYVVELATNYKIKTARAFPKVFSSCAVIKLTKIMAKYFEKENQPLVIKR